MEHFISSESVISLVARHHSTGAELPYHHLAKHLKQSQALDSLDTHNQILLALLDQTYHSSLATEPGFDSSRELHALHSRLGLLPLPEKHAGMTWQGQFTVSRGNRVATGTTAELDLSLTPTFQHLFGYGATYYSYLFDRAIASQVWRTVFQDDPLRRENGERYKNHVLRWGGGKDPWEMLGGLLEEDGLDMRKVGEWGIAKTQTG